MVLGIDDIGVCLEEPFPLLPVDALVRAPAEYLSAGSGQSSNEYGAKGNSNVDVVNLSCPSGKGHRHQHPGARGASLCLKHGQRYHARLRGCQQGGRRSAPPLIWVSVLQTAKLAVLPLSGRASF
eukprot:scaffold41080_cov46-Prasinocladus_malaysianus.AAC.1